MSDPIPLIDLKAQHASIRNELDAAMGEVLTNAQFILGPHVSAFERDFAEYCRVAHCAGLNSGTSALHLALLALGVSPGDEIITTPMTFVATTAAILYAGAKPVFVDIDPVTWNIDPARIEAAITPRTKGIMPVHLHGLMADMDAIMDISRRRNLRVIEDAAQAHGAEYKGRRAGSIGDIAGFSFYPGKNLGACGEAGAVVSKNADFVKTVALLRDWGQKEKYNHALKGYNYRMEGLQGAVLQVKLKHIEAWTESRRRRATEYDARLKGKLPIPTAPAHYRHVYHVYAVRVPNRDAVQTKLRNAGIATGIHYPVPVHMQPAYTELGYKQGDFPVAEQAGTEFLSLPIFPEMTEKQVDTVCTALLKAV